MTRSIPRTAATSLLSGLLLAGSVCGSLAAPALAGDAPSSRGDAVSSPDGDFTVPAGSRTVVRADKISMAPASAGWMFTGSAGRTQDKKINGLGLWRDGVATAGIKVTSHLAGDAGAGLSVTVGADRCEGGADMAVSVDGTEVLRRVIDADHDIVPLPVRVPGGDHTVTVAYSGDHVTESCDRALKLYAVSAYAAEAMPSEWEAFGPPTLFLSDQTAGLWRDLDRGGAEVMIWKPAAVSRHFTSAALDHAQVVVAASGDDCEGPAAFETYVDGRLLGRTDAGPLAKDGAFTRYVLDAGALAAGTHEVDVKYVDDLVTPACDRNLHVRKVVVHG